MKVISVKESVFSNNDRLADQTRRELGEKGTLLINVMSSPGSGKTTLLTRLIKNRLNKLRKRKRRADYA